MYIPEHYKNENQEEIHAFLNENAFGILVNKTNGKLWATHIPMELEIREDGKFLCGHVSKANPQWEAFATNDRVLAIFSGPHAYISSSWYDFEEVPTWNYIAVHVYGQVTILDAEKTLQSLKKLVDKYESGSENPIRLENLSTKTLLQARGVVAFEIKIDAIEAVKKMSQGLDQKNCSSVIGELLDRKTEMDTAIAEILKDCPYKP